MGCLWFEGTGFTPSLSQCLEKALSRRTFTAQVKLQVAKAVVRRGSQDSEDSLDTEQDSKGSAAVQSEQGASAV